MVAVGLDLAFQAKPSQDEGVAIFLRGVQREEQTTVWFAMRTPLGGPAPGAAWR